MYAAGESAAGLHGANRLGGNSLSDLLVFGNISGYSAANYAANSEERTLHKGVIEEAIKETLKSFDKDNTENPYKMHAELQDIMEKHVGIVREEKSLDEGIKKLENMDKRLGKLKTTGGREYNPSWHLCLDLKNMVITSLAVAKAAKERKESRGGHTRLDYPEYDAELEKLNIIIRKGPEGINVVKSGKIRCQKI